MKIATLKAQAANLRAALAKSGTTLTHAQALDGVAGQYGFDTWDALAATLKKAKAKAARTPTLADLPGSPESIEVERGAWSDLYQVVSFDFDSIVLVPDEKKLLEHIAKDPNLYYDGLDTTVIEVEGDGKDWQFTLRELQSAKYRELGGKGYWHIEDHEGDEIYICFHYEDVWTPSKAVENVLQIPEMAKSSKGSQVVVVPSLDGNSDQSRYIVVPAHLKAKDIADKVIAEVKRLKAADAALSDEEFAEKAFTEDDVKTFVQSLGCTWANPAAFITHNAWD